MALLMRVPVSYPQFVLSDEVSSQGMFGVARAYLEVL